MCACVCTSKTVFWMRQSFQKVSSWAASSCDMVGEPDKQCNDNRIRVVFRDDYMELAWVVSTSPVFQ